MRTDPKWLNHPDLQRVFGILTGAGHQAYVVGGCVRNHLLNCPITDIDLTTDARPDVVVKLFEDAGIKVVPTGLDHGTVTAVINDEPYEITTFRNDVETDGRRAVVAFAETIEEDSLRRDFTINALYMNSDGAIFDPQGGLPDINGPVFRFIGNPAHRIAEDYLRILRFFRFFAQYGHSSQGIEADGLAACAEAAEGLSHVSKERIGAEFVKILAAADPSMALAAMNTAGVLHRILPGADTVSVPILVHFEDGPPCAARRLATMGAFDPVQDLRWSKGRSNEYKIIRDGALSDQSPAALGYRLGQDRAWDCVLVRCALMQTPPSDSDRQDIAAGAAQTFPITAADLMPQVSGADLGKALRVAEQYWIDQNFEPSKADLVDHVIRS